MEILISIVGKIAELTVEPVGRQLSYLCFISDNIQKLKSNVEMLKETRESVQRMVCDARRNAEDIKPRVQNWLAKVDAIIEKSEVILTNEGQQVRFCLNLVQRHQLSRKAVKMAKEVLEMKNEGNFDRVSYHVALSNVEGWLTKTTDFLNFESRRSTIEKIMDALADNNVNKIGIYGMGGVGKTMIVKEISRKVMEKKLFDEVVILTISQTPDVKRIQGELAEKLGLKLEEDTIEGRALKLQKRLKMEKRCLVVLDDIWAPIDLETIGIPSDVDHKGCKILLTSRDKHTISNDMCIDKNFEIKVLQKDEAWSLFKKIVGETIEAFDLKHIAIQIVKKCANLPIAIITVAKALRNKSTAVWKDALNQLRHHVALNIKGMNDKVYASLKLSYEQLECDEGKMLFLLCSMFPEDFEIDVQKLHVYAMALGLLHGVDTIAQGRHRIRKLVDDLISASLLLKYVNNNNHVALKYANDHVKMHDLVRDVAILIASKDDQIRTLSNVKNSNEWEVNEMSGNNTTVYLDIGGCHSAPERLMFPKIQLLILVGRRWYCGQEFSINFFEEMKELKVLELQWIKISPSLLHSFTNVRSLHLFNCELENINMIGELNKLEILSFRGSNITQIPMAISQLTRLKVLDLSSCYDLKIIPPNVLSKLTKLEELNLKTYNGWEGEGEELNKERKNASLAELNNLSYLSALRLCIQDEKVMPKQLFSTELNLETFNISIGFPQQLHYHHREIGIIRKKLYLKMESKCSMNDGIQKMLKSSEKLHLEGSFDAKVFLFGLDENESSHVKYLDLVNIYGLQHVIHEQKQPFRKALLNLVHLHLSGLKNLESIIHGYDRRSPFNKLKFLKVNECKNLGSLFFKSIVDDLSNLEEIKIKDCEMIKVIVVMASEEATDKFEFTHLKILKLCRLAQLKSFVSKIEKGGTNKFSNNNSFFGEEVSLPNLEELKIKKADNLKMICGNVIFPNSFSKLAHVYIDSCNNLEKAFSSRMMSILTCLQIVRIKNCNLLEGIFEAEESNVTKQSVALLPQLRKLKLFNLPNLRYVRSEDLCELLVFEKLETLSLRQCPKLKKECVVKVLPQVKRFKMELREIKEIFEKEKSMRPLESDEFKTSQVETTQLQDGSELFSKLKTLKLHGSLDYHITHLSMEIIQILYGLEKFTVKGAFIEEIFPNEKLINVKENQCGRSELLWSLRLSKLPKLKHLWKEGSQNNTSLLLQYLNSLDISECGILNISVPSSVSFRNLSSLEVYKCHRLTHLLNPSVARTLVQLEYLDLRECKRLTTIIVVGGAEEGNDDEIVFNKLQTLVLENFSKLTSFHSGRCIIKFPCLKNAYIWNCPEMKVFSHGIVSTPRLKPETISIYNDDVHFFPKDHKEMIVEDINVITRQSWEDIYDTDLSYLFAEENLEEKQSDHSSSHVEE